MASIVYICLIEKSTQIKTEVFINTSIICTEHGAKFFGVTIWVASL